MKINLRSHHIALRVTDYARARQFYTEVLEMPVLGQIPGREIEFLGIGGTTIELMGGAEPESLAKPQAGLIHLAFEVEDVDATYRELSDRGVTFTVEPKSVGDLRVAFFVDPDGNELELFRSPTLTWS
ncbi:MAG: VOC family protein [Anaerolineae bacterium]|jgi:glyoxylase I family protein